MWTRTGYLYLKGNSIIVCWGFWKGFPAKPNNAPNLSGSIKSYFRDLFCRLEILPFILAISHLSVKQFALTFSILHNQLIFMGYSFPFSYSPHLMFKDLVSSHFKLSLSLLKLKSFFFESCLCMVLNSEYCIYHVIYFVSFSPLDYELLSL